MSGRYALPAMPTSPTFLQRASRIDWRPWLARLERLPAWKLFLAALLLGLMISLPWQCARLLGESKPTAPEPSAADAEEIATSAPQRGNVGRAQSILGMPSPAQAPAAGLPIADPMAEAGPGEALPAQSAPMDAGIAPGTAVDAAAAVAIHAPRPEYPTAALRSREEGTVMVRVDIDAGGLPMRVEVERSSRSRVLDRAAVEAVGQWRFKPAIVQGVAVESSLVVPISFEASSDE
jgi:protein TonB